MDIASLIRWPLEAWRERRRRRIMREALALMELGAARAPDFEISLALWVLESKEHARVWGELTAFAEEAARSAPASPAPFEAILRVPPAAGLLQQPRGEASRHLQQPRPRPLISRPAIAALAACVIALFAGALWVRYQPRAHAEYVTRIGEHRSLRLPDGTSVHLNTHSRIVVSFTRQSRRVDLVQGEALFEVAPDARPFRVRSDAAVIDDIGTRFDVRLDPQRLDVAVVEGRVRIGIAPAESPEQARAQVAIDTLNAGESVSIPLRANTARPVVRRHTAAALTSRLAWTMGMLQFSGEPLTDAVREINRYNVRQIEIADPTISGKRIGGQFLATSPERFARALRNVGVRALEPAGGWHSRDPIRLVSDSPQPH